MKKKFSNRVFQAVSISILSVIVFPVLILYTAMFLFEIVFFSILFAGVIFIAGWVLYDEIKLRIQRKLPLKV